MIYKSARAQGDINFKFKGNKINEYKSYMEGRVSLNFIALILYLEIMENSLWPFFFFPENSEILCFGLVEGRQI